MAEIYYVRHGQASLFSNNYDQLSEIGKEQSRHLGNYFQKENIVFDKCYLGPLQRHHETLEAINMGGTKIENVITIDGLAEHQGYSTLKKLLPVLVQSDEKIRNLVNRPFSSKSEQIKHHIKIYDHFSLRWALGEFDHLLDEQLEPWNKFEKRSSSAFKSIRQDTASGEKVLVVTSGGPVSIACKESLELNLLKTMELSSVIYNSSVTKILKNESKVSLTGFNHTHHLPTKNLLTLV